MKQVSSVSHSYYYLNHRWTQRVEGQKTKAKASVRLSFVFGRKTISSLQCCTCSVSMDSDSGTTTHYDLPSLLVDPFSVPNREDVKMRRKHHHRKTCIMRPMSNACFIGQHATGILSLDRFHSSIFCRPEEVLQITYVQTYCTWLLTLLPSTCHS
jgi:hypothetical protein